MYTQEILDHKTMHALAKELAEKHGEKLAFYEEFGTRVVSKSYARFLSDTENLARAIKKRYPNKHIALLTRGSTEFFMVFCAVIMAGGVVVPVDCEATEDETVREIIHSDSVACFYSDFRAKKINSIKDRLDGVELINIEENLERLIVKGSTLEDNSFSEDEDAPAAIFYTSGTTGFAKGVVLPQKALCSVACKAGCYVDVYESVLSVLPAHHTYGSVCGVLSIYGLARTVYFTKGLKTFMADLKKYKPSNLFVVPMFLQTMNKMIWATAEKTNKDKLLKMLLRMSQFLNAVCNVFVVPMFFGAVGKIVAKIKKEQREEKEKSGKKLTASAKMMWGLANLFIIPMYVFSMGKVLWAQAVRRKDSEFSAQISSVHNSLLSAKVDIKRALFKSVLKSFGGNLKTITSGGAPLDVKLQRSFEEMGLQILNGYGITECAPLVSVNLSKQNRFGTVRKALPYCEIMIDDSSLAGVGEVCVKGDNVMIGYYKDKEATDEVLIDGWFHTGDVGYLDDEGYLFITGRKKDMIVLPSGENVFPEVIEREFYRLKYIADAVVLWDDHAQALCVHVYFDAEADNSSFEKDLETINKGFAPYMRIKKTVIRDKEFEKTSTKKIKRFAI